ncbi:MAG: hypothetical protein P0116_16085, partial [Candidatus Nitrosocosmicus sp.]|nr:hypothetical protein [Candidatus Nitrosocosmicus sp.]
MEVLRKEIPLLAKLILDNSGKYDDIMYRIKEVGKLNSFDNHNPDNELSHQIAYNQATEYGNMYSENIQYDSKKIAAQEDHEGSRAYDPFQNIQGATQFSNVVSNDLEIDGRKIVKSQDIVEYDSPVKENSTPATEISNVQFNDATKNSNFRNPINIK